MLIKRIATAALLLAILLPVLWMGSPYQFGAVILVLIAAGVWEWARMNGRPSHLAFFSGVNAFGFCYAFMYFGLTLQTHFVLWLFATALWVLSAGYLLERGVASWATIAQWLRQYLGIFLICLAWLAAVQLRQIGINLLLSVLLLVWAADIGAYASGRLLGGKLFGARKLAIHISPGKTWEGVLGGFVCVLLVAYGWLWLDANYRMDSLSIYTRLWHRWGIGSIVVLMFLTTLAVVGDLLESLVKRSAGVKDSSHLLPGHGGVLDRVDALLPVLPAAMLLVSLA